MLKIGSIRFQAKCNRHPMYNPEDGRGAIRGGCPKCELLHDIHTAHTKLVELMRQTKNDTPKAAAAKAGASVDPRQTALF